MRHAAAALSLAFMSALVAAGCGGSPTSPSGSGEVVLHGTVVNRSGGAPGGVGSSNVTSSRAAATLVVTVAEVPAIRITVAADGSFTLRGLPEGTFTLVFTLDGTVVGTQTFSEVAANQEITITVEVVSGEVLLLDEHRTGIGHADVELEGLIERVIAVNPAGDSRFQIHARNVIARPGVTAIREGMEKRTVEDLRVNMRVHVKAALVEASTDLLAHEIKIQNADDPSGDTITICHIPPGNPANRRTLVVGIGAWPGHQGHGDTLGPCPN
jgi:hypothetical protein